MTNAPGDISFKEGAIEGTNFLSPFETNTAVSTDIPYFSQEDATAFFAGNGDRCGERLTGGLSSWRLSPRRNSRNSSDMYEMFKKSGCAGSQLSSDVFANAFFAGRSRLSPHRRSFNSEESGCAGSQLSFPSSNSSDGTAILAEKGGAGPLNSPVYSNSSVVEDLDAVCGSMQAGRASGSVVPSSGPVGQMGSSVSESIYGRLPTLTSLTARNSLSHGGSHQAAQAQHSGQLNFTSIRVIHLRAFSCRGSGFG